MPRYAVHGLIVESDVRLPAQASTSSERPDLHVRWGTPRRVGRVAPVGRVVAALEARRYSVVASDRGLEFWFDELAEASFDERERTLTIHADSNASTELVELLLGSMLAILLATREMTVLHASAIAREGRVVAFVGDEGSGKSTLAALFVRSGAELVTDDVLRVGAARGGVTWHRGTSDIRLRIHARDAGGVTLGQESTADGRVLLPGKQPDAACGPVDCIVLPRPERGAGTVRIDLLSQHSALVELAFTPRLRGLRDPTALRSQFRDLARIARSVPVTRAVLPWGPPFEPNLADELWRALAAAGALRS